MPRSRPFARFKIDPSTLPVPAIIRRSINKHVALAINEVMSGVFAKSQELVPVDTGALKASGVFIPAKSVMANYENPQAYINYGNADVDYALYVHENLEARHEAPTQAKFLETPLAQSEAKLMEAIKKATIKGALMGWKH